MQTNLNSAVICCCLPTLRPLLHMCYCGSGLKDSDQNTEEMSHPEVYLKMPPQIASRSSEEALEEYDFVKMSLADLQQYNRRTRIEGEITPAVCRQ